MSTKLPEIRARVIVAKVPTPEYEVRVTVEKPPCDRCASAIRQEDFSSFLRERFAGQSVVEIAAMHDRTPGYISELLEGIQMPDALILKRLGLEAHYRPTKCAPPPQEE
ncbi:MAG TPA: hypothetical protein VME18_02525 [Acidobacteriaceae bacterium]|nr:hypothetical protein [Acidobacteriaceae bacterium]